MVDVEEKRNVSETIDEITVPRGDGRDAIKARERIIRDFYSCWRKLHDEQKMYNVYLKDFINIRQVSVVETVEHASKNYLSTLAVLQLDAILTGAKKVKMVAADKKSKNQEKFDKMMIMEFYSPGIGRVKLTVGVMRRTHDKIQYCITSLEPIKQEKHP